MSTVLKPLLGSLQSQHTVRVGPEKISERESHLVIAGKEPGRDIVAFASSMISAEVFDWET